MVEEDKTALEEDVLSYVRDFAQKEVGPLAKKIVEEETVP